MRTDLVAEWAAIGLTGIIGAVGWVLAAIANRAARRSNDVAERANQLAAAAVESAAEANRLAEEANAIARTQSAKQSDPSHVEWDPKWDRDACVARIRNTGRDSALEPSVIVKNGSVTQLHRGDDVVPREGEILIPFPDVPEQRERSRAQNDELQREARASRVGIVTLPFGGKVTLDVRWRSELGNPGQQTLTLYIS